MSNEPFLRRSGAQFIPTPMARGFWGPADNLHARVVIGLFAHEIERLYGAADFTPARLTVDLYRLAGLSPIEVTTRAVRDGGRIKVIEAELVSGGVSSARASCQLLKRTAQPAGNIWRGPSWDAPAPEQIPESKASFVGGRWEVRPIGAAFGRGPGPSRIWLRETRELIEGESYTPFSRVATGVDFVSPISHSGDKGLAFINTDVTLYLHRPMNGEWVGYEVTNHQSSDGVAIGQCTLHDGEGPIGFATCAALAQTRAPMP